MSKYLSCFALFLVLSAFNPARAGHLISGEIYYTYLGSDNYRISLVLIRDCGGPGAQFDNPASLGIYNGTNLYQAIEVPISSPVDTLPYSVSCDTFQIGFNWCWETYTYDTIVNLPASSDGYTITYQRCCLVHTVVNIEDTWEDEGFSLSTTISGPNLTALFNSSPYFKVYPPLVTCLNDTMTFDHGAIDPDTDSLVYSLDSCWKGADNFNVAPNPPSPPPYAFFNYENGFSFINPLGVNSSVTVDASGNITFIPSSIGDYLVAVRVDEYRNGVLIGNTRRPFVIRVVSPITNSINENDMETLVQLSPNPANDYCTISHAKDANLTVLDSYGRTLFTDEIESDEEIIELDKYSAGLYYFLFDFDGQRVIRKINKL